jgi:hypothetical protein
MTANMLNTDTSKAETLLFKLAEEQTCRDSKGEKIDDSNADFIRRRNCPD